MRTSLSAEENLLIKHSLNGDKAAQMRLYKKYIQAMYNLVIRMVPNKMDAEDILQESFVKVFQHLGSFKKESTLGAWIKRIVINTALQFIRKKGRVSYMQIEDGAHFDEELFHPSAPVDMRRIHEAIKQLPEGCRIVLTLHLLEGYQHKEIAEILGITVSTSKSQYHRAKGLLKKRLGKQLRNYSF